MSENTSIVVCGKKFNIGTKVVLWDQLGGLNGYDITSYTTTYQDRKTGKEKVEIVSGKRHSKRSWKYPSPTLEQLQKLVTQFFLHHSGLYRARDTFHVLHKERGLSVHFILDDNGVLYQTVDVAVKAWHGGKCNPFSVGIEIDSKAKVSRFPTAYDSYHRKKYKVGPRRKRKDLIHGCWTYGYEYNDKQYYALISLAVALITIFPRLSENGPADFPRDNGEVLKTFLHSYKSHKGFICHYNTNLAKIDPIAFDHNRFLEGVRTINHKCPSAFIDLSTWSKKQSALKKLGYELGVIDGKFGPKTKEAIKNFQVDHGLLADGVWGKNTYVAVELALRNK